MALRWLIERTERPRADEIRFDAIAVVIGPDTGLLSLEHLEGAF
jgi:hypothetical protein